MKFPRLTFNLAKPRPYWHVDAKWLCGLLLIVTLAATLPVAAVHRLTTKEVSTDLIAYTFAGMTSPQGIDSSEGLDEVKARVAQNGSETVTIAGIDVVFTAEDVNSLSPRELRLKVFREFATRLYDKGARGFAESQGFDAATVEKFENDAALVNVFSKPAHQKVGAVLFWLVLVDLLLLAGLVFFSRRFGRLVSPGLVLLLVGLPGFLFAAIASSNPEVSGAARSEDAPDQLAAVSLFFSYVAPLVVPHLAAVYLPVLVTGAVLLALAGVGRVVFAVVRHGKHQDDTALNQKIGKEPKADDKKP